MTQVLQGIKHIVTIILSAMDRIFVRVFLSFSLCILLMVGAVLMIPQWDTRRITSVSDAHAQVVLKEVMALIKDKSDRLQQVDNASKRWHKRQGRRNLIILDSRLYPAQMREQQLPPPFANFIEQTINQTNVQKQRIHNRLIIGPMIVPTQPDQRIYVIHDVRPPGYWLLRLLDEPLLLFLVMVMIGLPMIALLSWSLTRPMQRLRSIADRMTQGHWKDLPVVGGPQEYRAVSESFLRMVERMTALQREKDQLFANLSHELRTPLSRIGLIHALLRRKHPDLVSELEMIGKNIDILEERIQAMLDISRSQLLMNESKEIIELSEVLTPVLEAVAFEADAMHKHFEVSALPQVKILAHVVLLQSAVENVLRNALRFAQSQVHLEIQQKNSQVIIYCRDDGPGVSEDELTQLFTPFFRGEQADQSEGAGLGLAIAKSAIESHGGAIEARNGDKGLCIRFQLPSYFA